MDGTLTLLPPQVTNEILGLIAEIDEFKGAWRALGRIAPERLASLRRVATIESVGSSTRIEGARLTIREAARATGVSRNTIKDHVKKLVAGGHLTRHGAGRGTWYSLA